MVSKGYIPKNVHSLQNTILSCPYFVIKNLHSLKTLCSHEIFSTFFLKNPMLSHVFGQKLVNSVRTTIYYRQKVKKMDFSTIFHEKKPLSSCPYFVKSLLSKKPDLMPIFCQKYVHSLKSTVFSFHF